VDVLGGISWLGEGEADLVAASLWVKGAVVCTVPTLKARQTLTPQCKYDITEQSAILSSSGKMIAFRLTVLTPSVMVSTT